MRSQLTHRPLSFGVLAATLLVAGCGTDLGTGLLALSISPDPNGPPAAASKIVLAGPGINRTYNGSFPSDGGATLVLEFPDLPASNAPVALTVQAYNIGCQVGTASFSVKIQAGAKTGPIEVKLKAVAACGDGGVVGPTLDSGADGAETGSADAFADGPGDGASDGSADGVARAFDSGAEAVDAAAAGIDGGGEAGPPDAPYGQPDVPAGSTDAISTGGAGGTSDAAGRDGGASGGSTGTGGAGGPDDAGPPDAPYLPTGGAGGNPGAGGTTGTGGTATGGVPTGGTGGTATGGTVTGGTATTGGTTASGGTTISGGTTASGGTTTTGGTTASGGTTGTGGTTSVNHPSCVGLAKTCGPSGDGDCCESLLVPGGTFNRSNDPIAPATVADFYLDKYEITVGRFRQFVNKGMGTQASPPAAGAGVHPRILGSGWDSTWNANLPTNTAALTTVLNCDSNWQTWTDTPGANESKPENCIVWYEAFAFCAWDGGRLATEAEWNYAAAGGSDQRYYPWSTPSAPTTIDDSYAIYCGGSCGGTQNVGSKSPKGDGKWQHSDLAGNVWEWTLDWYADSYQTPCDNCADFVATTSRAIRGGFFLNIPLYLQTAGRGDALHRPGDHYPSVGSRCARTGS